MTPVCGGDPLLCIEFVVLATGEFLHDWTTMAMLALLLGLLFRLRADRRKAREAAYARRLAAYDEKRSQESKEPTWVVPNDKAGER